MRLSISLLIIIFSWADVLIVDVPIPEYQISDNMINMEKGAYIHLPGAPSLPGRKLTIALPPGAIFESVKFYGTREELTSCAIAPMLPALPLTNKGNAIAKIWESYKISKDRFYCSDRLYPETYGVLLSKGGLRKYTLVDVFCYHFAYSPVSQRLYYTPNIRVEIHYRMPAPGSERAQFWQRLINDITYDNIAEEVIYNWHDARVWYRPRTPNRANGYTIIITTALESSVNALAAYRQSQGYDVNIVTKEYIESNIAGNELAQKIRNYLRENMVDIEYVLMVGNASPMRLLVPWNNDPDSPYDDDGYSPIPSDLYYAELTDHDSLSWNSDGDSYYGEVYNQDTEPYGDDDPDYHADVHVGRITSSTQSIIEDICDKIIAFDGNSDLSYKTASLLAGGMIYFENENYGGYPRIDGADDMEQLMNDSVFDRSNAAYIYEMAGLNACPYTCTDSLTRSNMISYWNKKGIVYEFNHGAPESYARKVWTWDDGDSVAESSEIDWYTCLHTSDVDQLDNDYPATTFLRSCSCGKPEVYSLGIQLLEHGSSAVISSSRYAWVSLADRGGIPHHFYYRLMKDTLSSHGIVGNAYDLARNDFMDSTGFWIPAYHYNLYGDPALHQFGASVIVVEESQKSMPHATFSIYPNPSLGTVTIQLHSSKEREVELDVYDESGRFLQCLYNGYVEEGTKKLNTDLPTGVYFLRLKDGDNIQVKKFIITH